MTKLTIVTVLVLAITQCFCDVSGRPRLDGRLVGGELIDITDAPYNVCVGSWIGRTCGGSILNEKWILTSGHCLLGSSASRTKVRAGLTTVTLDNSTGVARIVNHPNFNANDPIFLNSMDYDFSLIELANNLTFNSSVQPIGLVEQNQEYPDDTTVLVTGWGVKASLRKISVALVNHEECNDIYVDYGGVTDRMICAGRDRGIGICYADTGSPMVLDGKLIGMASWGHGCAEPGHPGVYARVASVRSWIKTVTGI